MTNTILGTHNGINLIRKEDGSEFYYSTKTKKTAISLSGFARLVGCNQMSISNLASKLELGKEHQMYTPKGIQAVKLLMEDDLPKIFEAIASSKMKKETKQNAASVSAKFIQAGFRLMVMLEVAPEEVAKEAINHITDTSKAREVKIHAEVQEKYLESFHGLQDAIQKTGAHHGVINGHNNKLVGIENGARVKADSIQKRALQMIQTAEELKLEANRESYANGWHATNSAKKAGTKTAELIGELLTTN